MSAKAKFDSKDFNSEAFGVYSGLVAPDLTKNELISSAAFAPSQEVRDAFSATSGTFFASIPMHGVLAGDPDNYDGATDITTDTLSTMSQDVTVFGRMHGWTERDFAFDITSGVDFISQVAQQVVKYWSKKKQATVISILKGIFSMASGKGLEFVNSHTLDISEATGTVDGFAANKVNVSSLNTIAQKACGDNMKNVTLCIMHSAVSAHLESLKLLTFLKYTDAQGIEKPLPIGYWNGRLVLVDDGMPAEYVAAHGTVAAVAAHTAVDFTANLSVGDTISINGVTFTAIVNGGSPTATQFALGATLAATLDVISALTVTGVALTDDNTDTLTITASTAGAAGNIIPVNVVSAAVATGEIDTTLLGGADAQASTDGYYKYTTFVLGNGAFIYEELGAKVPYEMSRDPKTNGGQDTLYTRTRTCISPRGINVAKPTTNSPTNAFFEDGTHWSIVKSGDATPQYYDPKGILIARIISR